MTASAASGIQTSMDALLRLRHLAARLKPVERRAPRSPWSGVRRSSLRGRGMEFEEVRHYAPGDDVRTIDWRVTARSGSPHTKLYREERERPVLLVVDQRRLMYFGSRRQYKAVLAAEIAALLAWQGMDAGDRIGGIVFNDHEHAEIRPARSRASVLRLLQHLVDFNQALAASPTGDGPPPDVLASLRRIARPGARICLIGDLEQLTEASAARPLRDLARHCELLALHCFDPLEHDLPAAGSLAVVDGRRRAVIDAGAADVRAAWCAAARERMSVLSELFNGVGARLQTASTDAGAASAVSQMLGLTLPDVA